MIDDNFFKFWFQFVFRNKSLLEENKISEVALKIEEKMPDLLAKNYEKVSGEILSRSVLDKKLPVHIDTYGQWWDKNEEIDLVAINNRTNDIVFGEVKWSNKQVGTNIYEDLKRKTPLVEWDKKDRKEHFVLFSKSGFTPELKKLVHSEKNIYLFHKDTLLD